MVTPTVSTLYTVTGTNSVGCVGVATSSISVNLCTNIQNANENKLIDITIYPNPNNGQFIISLAQDAEVFIIDVLGREVYSENLNSGKHSINLENQVSGVYFIKTTIDGHSKINKIVKN